MGAVDDAHWKGERALLMKIFGNIPLSCVCGRGVVECVADATAVKSDMPKCRSSRCYVSLHKVFQPI